jgi:hypothetical protein
VVRSTAKGVGLVFHKADGWTSNSAWCKSRTEYAERATLERSSPKKGGAGLSNKRATAGFGTIGMKLASTTRQRKLSLKGLMKRACELQKESKHSSDAKKR